MKSAEDLDLCVGGKRECVCVCLDVCYLTFPLLQGLWGVMHSLSYIIPSGQIWKSLHGGCDYEVDTLITAPEPRPCSLDSPSRLNFIARGFWSTFEVEVL